MPCRIAAALCWCREVDHCRATDGQHHSQNQPTLVNDDKSWKLCELRVFNGNQQRSITVGWHSQGGSAGSNPVGATTKRPGQTACALSEPLSPSDLDHILTTPNALPRMARRGPGCHLARRNGTNLGVRLSG